MLYSHDVPSTWLNLLDSSDIDAFEDPVYGTIVPRCTYLEIYGSILQTLDGSDMTSHVNFFFRRCPLNFSILRFTDDDTKHDFYEEAKLAGILPPLHEIHQGESEKDKLRRSGDQQKKRQANKPQPFKLKPQLDTAAKQAKIQAQIDRSLDNLLGRLAKSKDGEETNWLLLKIEKTRRMKKLGEATSTASASTDAVPSHGC